MDAREAATCRIAGALGLSRDALAELCERHRVAVLARLPFVAAELADIIGFEAMLKMVDAFGGTEIYLATAACPSNALRELIGAEAADAVFNRYGNGRFLIPSPHAVVSMLRLIIVQTMRVEGRSADQIARRTGFHVRTIKRDIRMLRAGALGEAR